MPFDFISGNEGDHALGSKNLDLGPCNAYYGSFTNIPCTGTISASNSTTVEGTGTAFTSQVKPGDWLKSGSVVFQVKSVTDADTLVAMNSVTISSGSFAKIDCVYLGGTDSTVLKYGLSKQGLQESQNGTSDADKAITGYTASVDLGLTRATLVRMEKMLQGFQTVRDAATGLYKGAGFGLPIGETDLDIAKELRLVKFSGGRESIVGLDTLRVLKCAPASENESAFDASTQRIFKITFNAYPDQNTLLNGIPQIWVMGDIAA